MFEYKQRPATTEYRDNWERLYALPRQSPAEVQSPGLAGLPSFVKPPATANEAEVYHDIY